MCEFLSSSDAWSTWLLRRVRSIALAQTLRYAQACNSLSGAGPRGGRARSGKCVRRRIGSIAEVERSDPNGGSRGQAMRPRSWAAATASVRVSTRSFWNRL